MTMFYRAVGFLVVKGAKVFLRRKYGPTYTPRPVLAAGVVAAIVGVAVVAGRSRGA